MWLKPGGGRAAPTIAFVYGLVGKRTPNVSCSRCVVSTLKIMTPNLCVGGSPVGDLRGVRFVNASVLMSGAFVFKAGGWFC